MSFRSERVGLRDPLCRVLPCPLERGGVIHGSWSLLHCSRASTLVHKSSLWRRSGGLNKRSGSPALPVPLLTELSRSFLAAIAARARWRGPCSRQGSIQIQLVRGGPPTNETPQPSASADGRKKHIGWLATSFLCRPLGRIRADDSKCFNLQQLGIGRRTTKALGLSPVQAPVEVVATRCARFLPHPQDQARDSGREAGCRRPKPEATSRPPHSSACTSGTHSRPHLHGSALRFHSKPRRRALPFVERLQSRPCRRFAGVGSRASVRAHVRG